MLRKIAEVVSDDEWVVSGQFGPSGYTVPEGQRLQSCLVFKAPNSSGCDRTIAFGVWHVADGESPVQKIPQAVTPSGQLAPIEPIPFDPPYVPVEPSGFMVPTGTYRGRRLSELDNDTLRNLYNGFKGCGKRDVADQILAEIHLRRDL